MLDSFMNIKFQGYEMQTYLKLQVYGAFDYPILKSIIWQLKHRPEDFIFKRLISIY